MKFNQTKSVERREREWKRLATSSGKINFKGNRILSKEMNVHCTVQAADQGLCKRPKRAKNARTEGSAQAWDAGVTYLNLCDLILIFSYWTVFDLLSQVLNGTLREFDSRFQKITTPIKNFEDVTFWNSGAKTVQPPPTRRGSALRGRTSPLTLSAKTVAMQDIPLLTARWNPWFEDLRQKFRMGNFYLRQKFASLQNNNAHTLI